MKKQPINGGVPQLHFLSNLGVLASFSHSHMTNKQEYKQK
jgi:hypothetical protein